MLATFRQAWNMARRSGFVTAESPTRSVKLPKFDNKRQGFFSHEEADLLLVKLKEKNETVSRMALLSLHTGMRASEILSLTWGCVDTDRGIIAILDTKSGKSRTAFMTDQLRSMFLGMKRSKRNDLVFFQRKMKLYGEIPPLFRHVVEDLKLNENITDKRQRLCFHSLRHTFASWHAENGTNLYVIKELLGHGSIQLTERYSHLSKGTLQDATKNLEKSIAKKKKGEVIELNK
ncbi:MAG: site-specific integrase [Deltaproteobacteria bacterium]|nr:site-specific integrase [Deltaproteobacteria bacterium]